MSPDLLLRLERLVKSFGGFHALDGLSLALGEGEILGLVGPNGSGKTTCINVISGLYAPDSGTITFGGTVIQGMKPHRLVHLGINRTFQVPKPFLTLTVRQNVEIAATYGRGSRTGRTPQDLLDWLGLARLAERPAHELNSAEQKRLDLARALATSPRLLLVDELAAGLNPAELGAMAETLREIARSGVALLVVEHLLGFLGAVTQRVIVMNAGKEIFEGTLDAAARDKEVVAVFLGSDDHGSGHGD